MLDTFIKERAEQASYSPDELNTIFESLGDLKNILGKQNDLIDPVIGGSLKRGTIVKGVSDVDIFYQYTGPGDPRSTLVRLLDCLEKFYPDSYIKCDQPAVAVTLNTIPFKITLCRTDEFGNIWTADDFLINWRVTDMGKLEESVATLGKKSSRFITLIKILKLWNYNYGAGMTNSAIEHRVCQLFLNPKAEGIEDDLPEMMWMFFHNNRFQPMANKVFSLMTKKGSGASLKREWLKFIEND